MAALFQLSYSPFEVEVVSKVNACALAVAWRRQAKAYLVHAREPSSGEQERAVELAAVDAE
jgi:hypothetical protein